MWNWLVIGSVKGPQSRAWKVLTTVRVEGRGGRGWRDRRHAGLVAWDHRQALILQETLTELVGRLTPAW